VVALIAERHLTQAARAEVARLLAIEGVTDLAASRPGRTNTAVRTGKPHPGTSSTFLLPPPATMRRATARTNSAWSPSSAGSRRCSPIAQPGPVPPSASQALEAGHSTFNESRRQKIPKARYR
jgi:hypothetical protein